MMAIIKALEFALRNNDESPKIFTDSKLSLNTCETWIHGWVKKKILRTKKNPDLLEQVYPLLLRAKPKFQWVRGHN